MNWFFPKNEPTFVFFVEVILIINEFTFLFLGEVIPIIMGEVIPIHYAVGRPPGRLIGGVGALAPTITGGVGGGSPPP